VAMAMVGDLGGSEATMEMMGDGSLTGAAVTATTTGADSGSGVICIGLDPLSWVSVATVVSEEAGT